MRKLPKTHIIEKRQQTTESKFLRIIVSKIVKTTHLSRTIVTHLHEPMLRRMSKITKLKSKPLTRITSNEYIKNRFYTFKQSVFNRPLIKIWNTF